MRQACEQTLEPPCPPPLEIRYRSTLSKLMIKSGSVDKDQHGGSRIFVFVPRDLGHFLWVDQAHVRVSEKHAVYVEVHRPEGHPDKFCDQISDAVLDECLRLDPEARVACNTFVTMGLIFVGGQTRPALFSTSSESFASSVMRSATPQQNMVSTRMQERS